MHYATCLRATSQAAQQEAALSDSRSKAQQQEQRAAQLDRRCSELGEEVRALQAALGEADARLSSVRSDLAAFQEQHRSVALQLQVSAAGTCLELLLLPHALSCEGVLCSIRVSLLPLLLCNLDWRE
jgi:septal ring factor EnvC (AmiA/AmiB activator)